MKVESLRFKTDITPFRPRVGRSETVCMHEIIRKEPPTTICYVMQRDKETDEQCANRIRKLLDVLEAGVDSLTAKINSERALAALKSSTRSGLQH